MRCGRGERDREEDLALLRFALLERYGRFGNVFLFPTRTADVMAR